MPFRLTNTPTTFQAYINCILSDLLDIYYIVYLDNILIYSNSEDEHIEYIRKVLERLCMYKLYCTPEKYKFYIDIVGFLGFVILSAGVSIEPERIKIITEWPELEYLYDIL